MTVGIPVLVAPGMAVSVPVSMLGLALLGIGVAARVPATA